MFKISLKAARVNANLTLSEVAKALKKDRSTIIAWEKGRADIKIKDFNNLCKLYNISGDFIILPNTLQKVEENKNADTTQKEK